VNHETQKNPFEQEVKVERKEHGFSLRRADYAFYLAPNFRDVKFYIEAKKPFGDIATPDNYFQTIRYGLGSERLPPLLPACYASAWPLAMPALTK
jgi:adenine-specific DNA-methyltransferase